MGKSCCRCCSFDSLGCRLRTLKVFGALLFLFGTVFALAGIAIGFLSDLYFDVISLPDVFTEYILYAYLVVTTGIVALGTGLAAIYIAKTMSDDDCSTRGLAILALLTIVCSLATVGVPAWPLYEGGYFLEIPAAQTSMNMTTSIAVTATPLPVADAQRNIGLVDPVNPDATVTDGTSIDRNRRATNETTSMNATASSNSTSNETMDAGGSNMTSPNMTSPANETTTTNAPASSNSTSNETMDTGGANMTSSNMTSDTMPSSNMTSDNSTDAVSTTPDGNSTVNTSGSTSIMTTKEHTPGTTEYYTTSNSTGNVTAYALTREPIDYDEWLLIMAPFGIISIFAFIFIFFCLFIFCIACCCPERSEIVDDIDLYKS